MWKHRERRLTDSVPLGFQDFATDVQFEFEFLAILFELDLIPGDRAIGFIIFSASFTLPFGYALVTA
ncbi:hypothetical protein [Methylococcus mesophilus]|uniref:hypothetical protein n=1 Tax=Methylococcus mesophilus TaxID=2993564 RepID=UPI00224B17C8|nr:hypothetical protein [Methylococcus mesophilus]UZR29176.1 hypothetical protein OOT43_00700 [Methylococcus mesophilus]